MDNLTENAQKYVLGQPGGVSKEEKRLSQWHLLAYSIFLNFAIECGESNLEQAGGLGLVAASMA